MSTRNQRPLRFVRLFVLTALALAGCKPPPLVQGRPWEEFSGERALGHVQALVALGPRPPGSEAIEKARAYIEESLKSNGWEVLKQPVTRSTPRGPVTFVNLIARRPNQWFREGVYLVASHYDTKIFDSIRFVGANDGGSSTGVLLELARVLNTHRALADQVELIFFDGEEAFERFSATDGLYGSRYFASQAKKAGKTGIYRGGILLDMVGDRDLTITLPLDSPTKLAQRIFAAADVLKVRDHFSYYNSDILDDHSPLNAVGIPTIDLIDFDYPPWHTAGDTMDKLSAQSLQIVGSVTLYFLSEFAFQ